MKIRPDLDGSTDDRTSELSEESFVEYDGVKIAIVVRFGGGFLVALSSSLARELLIDAWIEAVLMCKKTDAFWVLVKSSPSRCLSTGSMVGFSEAAEDDPVNLEKNERRVVVVSRMPSKRADKVV